MTSLAQDIPSKDFKLRNVLVFTKTTRFELERERHSHVPDPELKALLDSEGTDADHILRAHEEHKKHEKDVFDALNDLNITTKTVDRFSVSDEDLNWADAVVPLGGDGTFLIAASKIKNRNKVVFGFNTNPTNSTGYLCLPKCCSSDIRKTLYLIKEGRFSWMFRTRIRVTLFGADKNKCPVYLHAKSKSGEVLSEAPIVDDGVGRIIPELALNEIFIGEKVSSRVSYLSLQLDDGALIRTKSSGLCVSTGSGSTAWNFTMNRMSRDRVKHLLSFTDCADADVDTVVNKYNSSLIFGAEEHVLSYTVRDLISTADWPKMPDIDTRGYVKKLFVNSSCIDAGLVMDGGLCYCFNSGTSALLEIHDSDALRSIVIKEEDFKSVVP